MNHQLTEEEVQVGMVIMKYVITRNRGRLGSYGIDDEEATSMGLVGLAKAIKEYDEATCQTTWFKFAYQIIWESIFRTPSTISHRRFIIDTGISRIRDLYYKKTGWKLTDGHLASLLDANKKFPKILKDHFRKTSSLPYAITEDGEARGISLADDRVSPEPENTLNDKDFVETVHDIVNNTDILDEIERGIINLYYGFDEPRLNFRGIARRLHRSEDITREFFNEAIEKLKCDSRLKGLHSELVEA